MRVMSPQDISAGMLRSAPYNLNEQSCDATVHLIQGVLDCGVDVTKIFVDTVGEPNAYAAKLKRHFPQHGHIEWKVARKADATYPIVGAASIAAKVTRDACIDTWEYAEQSLPGMDALLGKRKRKVNEIEEEGGDEDDGDESHACVWETGSGYPGDPKTVRYLKETLDPVFGWTGLVRFSWATAKSMLEEPLKANSMPPSLFGIPYPPSATRAYKVQWTDEAAKAARPQKTLTSFFAKSAPKNARAISTVASGADAPSCSDRISEADRKAAHEHRSSLWRQMALCSTTAADLF